MFTVTATDTNGACGGSQGYTVSIACPTILIGPATLPSAYKTNAYSQQLTASAGTAAFTFTITGGGLPAGFSMNGAGLITGSSAVIGQTNFSVMVTDTHGCTGVTNYTFKVLPNNRVHLDTVLGQSSSSSFSSSSSIVFASFRGRGRGREGGRGRRTPCRDS